MRSLSKKVVVVITGEVVLGRGVILRSVVDVAHLGKVHVEQFDGNREITLVEVIGHIPSNFTVFTPVLDDGVEEADTEHKWFECLMRALVELVF